MLIRKYARREGKSNFNCMLVAYEFIKSNKAYLELIYNNEHYCANINTYYVKVMTTNCTKEYKEQLYKIINYYIP